MESAGICLNTLCFSLNLLKNQLFKSHPTSYKVTKQHIDDNEKKKYYELKPENNQQIKNGR